jgi:quercetin dioxygenase-like cupin family protein
MTETTSKEEDHSKPWVGDLNSAIQFAENGIVSKTLVDCPKSKIVLFSMVTGQSISGHAAGTAATIHVLQGKADIQLDQDKYEGKPGSFYYMPAKLYHAVRAEEDLVFLLTLFR